MKKKSVLIIALLVTVAVLTLNGLYFEYCISRETPMFLSMIATFIIAFVDIFSIAALAKLIKSILKLKI